MWAWLNAHAKAIMAALAGAVSMYFALKGDGMTADEWMTVVMAALAAGGVTWGVPNGGAPQPSMPSVTVTTAPSTSGQSTVISSEAASTSSNAQGFRSTEGGTNPVRPAPPPPPSSVRPAIINPDDPLGADEMRRLR